VKFGLTFPALPPRAKQLTVVASAWVVKNQRAVIAAGGVVGVFLALIFVLVSRANPGPAAEPNPAPKAPAATSVVAQARPAAPPVAPSTPPSAVEIAPPAVTAPSAAAPPAEPARTAAPKPRPKRPRQSLYPVLKPPNL
jgi:hypothetical protein